MRRRPAFGAAAGTLLAGTLLAGTLLAACGGGVSPQAVAHSYLADWGSRDWAGMRRLVAAPPADFAAVNAAALADLSVRRASYRAGALRTSGDQATEPVTEQLEISGIGAITIRTVLRLSHRTGTWLVHWSPATIAPPLRPGGRLSLQTTWPPRAAILGAGDAPLTTQAPMVTIGVEGQLVRHAASLTAALAAAGATTQEARAALSAAKARPTWFEPVFTVSQARYEQLKPALYPLPGTVFQTTRARTAITAGLAAHLVGTVGPVTAEELRSLGAPYTAQSVVGQTGLEQADERQLSGEPGATVTVLGPSGAPQATLARLSPRPGVPVRTTLDPGVQRAAEAALAGEKKSAALVAVDATTGAVLASVSVPASSQFDQALAGAFPPGSSFKVITSAALIAHGLTPASAASCPPTVTVDGELFHNAPGTAPISDFLHAFAESCNTAFIQLATGHLTASDFPSTAALFGIGKTPRMGLPAFGGSVPAPADPAGLAATTIGQGQVLVSPLVMAMAAATADTGTMHAPRLVDGAPDDQAAATTLPRAVVSDLHQMMAQVVATGTAAHQGLPAGTHAKTGTAQYGTGHPLPTDAWLIGFNGNIAFAMVVVDGGDGGPTDGPRVAKFLDLVHGSGG
ncbi:MAG TPA: penicillin-binding transpeptidase domain-containing protein [Streptosporangiaceae bacterium]|nr:penicillin-binding transpeptidase domain-containing protein [Streptosporangiaceae bacterium]